MNYFLAKLLYPYDFSDRADIFEFIRVHQEMPALKHVFLLTRKCESFEDAAKITNDLFVNALKQALVRHISGHYNYELRESINVEFIANEEHPSLDDIHITFKNTHLINPNREELERLRYYVKTCDNQNYLTGVSFPSALQICLGYKDFSKIKTIVHECVFSTEAKHPHGQEFIIVDLILFKYLAKSESSFNKQMERLWKIVKNHNPELEHFQKMNTKLIIFSANVSR